MEEFNVECERGIWVDNVTANDEVSQREMSWVMWSIWWGFVQTTISQKARFSIPISLQAISSLYPCTKIFVHTKWLLMILNPSIRGERNIHNTQHTIALFRSIRVHLKFRKLNCFHETLLRDTAESMRTRTQNKGSKTRHWRRERMFVQLCNWQSLLELNCKAWMRCAWVNLLIQCLPPFCILILCTALHSRYIIR